MIENPFGVFDMFSAYVKNEFIYNHYFTMDIIRIRKYAVKYAASIEDMTLERLQIFENLLIIMIDNGYENIIPSLLFSRTHTYHIQVKSELLQYNYTFNLLKDNRLNLIMIDIMYKLSEFVLHLIDKYDAIFIENKLFIPLPNYGYLEFKTYTKAANLVLNINQYCLIHNDYYLII